MTSLARQLGAVVMALALITFVIAKPSSADETGWSFEEIMTSVAAQGSMSNGDGHFWTFSGKNDGNWEVEGARGNTAQVTDAGPDKIKISGFPSNWNADGKFKFSIKSGKCRLKSEHSRHRLKWKC